MSKKFPYVYDGNSWQPVPPTNAYATSSLTTGIVAASLAVFVPVPGLGLLVSLPVLVLGILAISLSGPGRRFGTNLGVGHGASVAGAVLGWASVATVALTTIVWLSILS